MIGKALLLAACVALAAATLPIIPSVFDAKVSWDGCANVILNQASCGSCWAFATVESYTDRLCLNGEAPNTWIISMQQILSCSGSACNGGWPSTAYNYMHKNGEPTCEGTCLSGCSPYLSGNCAEGKDTANDGCVACSTVNTACHNGTSFSSTPLFYPAVYQGAFDWTKGVNNAVLVMQEIMARGPIFTCFSVYNNFYSFFGSSATKTGVYDTTNSSSYVGGHCVKVVGWGNEFGKDYWLVANSWASSWGDHGYFRIIRGQNLCGFETGMGYLLTAGQAKAASIAPSTSWDEAEVSAMPSGGMLHSQDAADAMISKVAKAVVDELARQGQHADLAAALVQSKVVKAETQVVAGINYFLTLSGSDAQYKMEVFRALDASLDAHVGGVRVHVPAERAPKF